MKKKIRELNWDDLGKKVMFLEDDGDRYTGILEMVVLSQSVSNLTIGRATVNVTGQEVNLEVEFID